MKGHAYGDADMFGLDEFGQPVGLNPLWGAIAGSALGTGTTIALRRTALPGSTTARYAEGIGGLVAAAAGGVMAVFPGSRAAGWTAIATAALNNGLRQLDQYLQMQAVSTSTAPPMRGWGEVTFEPRQALKGLDMVTAEERTALGSPMPTLVGDNGLSRNPAAGQVRLLGGPPMSGLSSHWGATLFSH